MYANQLFANEVMLLPYYIAALNIEHAYYELTGNYESFEGLCFVDTLDMAEARQLAMFTEENSARVARQKKAPITVIIGNPPYNMNQQNENDNNKNRKYATIDARIKQTYVRDSRATLNNKLYDPYVKFFRWATDRLNGRDGIVCFVTNNSFIDQIAFDGMRKHLMQEFSRLYHVHLEGNVQHNPGLAGSTYNVFGIKVGVGVTIAIRSKLHKDRRLFFQRVDKCLRKQAKLAWLAESTRRKQTTWRKLVPDDRYTWLVPEHAREFARFISLGDKQTKTARASSGDALFKVYSLGIATNRDAHVYAFESTNLKRRVETFIEVYNSAVDTLKRRGAAVKTDVLIDTNDVRIKWTRQVKAALQKLTYSEFRAKNIRNCLYRPYSRLLVYFDDFWNEERYRQHKIFPKPATESENKAITLTGLGSEKPFMTLVVQSISDLHLVGAGCGSQCFPFYVYDENGSNRRENITDWALEQFRKRYKSKKIAKWDIFHYVYGVLHHPGYREKFADNLKRELPRIPFVADFKAFCKAGKELARLHLEYEQLDEWPLKWIEPPDLPLSYHVDKMKLTKDKSALIVNPSLTLAGIPPETFDYRLGNRSALDWVIDQYQISEDKRSGIRSDPNRADDPQYIVRLVGQVVRVSVETVRIVNSLPRDGGW